MSVFSWISLFSCIVCSINASVVLHSNPRARLNRYFVASNTALALFTFTEFLYRQSENQALVVFWSKVNFVFLCAVCLFLLFLFVYTGRHRLIRHPLVIALVYVPALAFIPIGLTTDLINGSPVKSPWGYVTFTVPSVPVVYFLFNSWIVLLGVFMVVLLARYFGTTAGARDRAQAKYFIIGFVPIVAAGLVELALAYSGIIIPTTLSTTLVWLNVCIGYAIWKQELFAPDAGAAADNIIAALNDPLLLVSRTGTITLINPAFRALFGYDETDIVGRSIRMLFAHDADESGIPDLLAAGARLANRETELVTKSGDRVYALLSGGVIANRLKRSWGFVLIVHDITRRKQDERELALLAVDLERSNRELESFVYAASHDLKEPLRKVIIYGERLLENNLIPEAERENVQRIAGAANRMRHLIDGLLEYAHVTRGRAAFASVDLNALLAETLADLEINLKQSGGTVSAAPLPVVTADPILMRQLFQNLVSNALKYRRDEVPPVVKISSETADGTVFIRVEDNGIGFDNNHRERMFRIFQRLVGKTDFEGAGIGLAICRKIVEHHGGHISASGVPGKGSVFTVELPQSPRPGRDD
jgi:two-component system, LuxR family, sensor kinase FixL